MAAQQEGEPVRQEKLPYDPNLRAAAKCPDCEDGIMTLWPGPIKAPCLTCSPDARLEDLLDAIASREERKRIAEHNAKTGWAK
jgi:hypothetical protein